MCENFELCPKYCHLQDNVDTCSHFRIKNCIGICSDIAHLEEYNGRVTNSVRSLKETKSDYAIKLKGRNPEEYGFVLVHENLYSGYGYVSKDTPLLTSDDFETYVNKQRNTLETQRIVESFVRKNPKRIVSFRGTETFEYDQSFNL
ncbi:hypothetical protein [Maribacter litopenaei]|uniref:hypothetical protein n=1 Tax=Maribacter litopenaei TaxID=2976127 RepID=UPI0030845DF6